MLNMDFLSAPNKPTKGLFQKIIGLHHPSPFKMAATVYLSPSSVHYPCLDPHGNQAILDESIWDKHIVNIRDYPKLQVVQKDGGWFALNSAQLQLFQKWEREGKCSKVKVDIVSIQHVPPVLRNLMVLGAVSDRKHFKRDLSDKIKVGQDSSSNHKALDQKSSQYKDNTQTNGKQSKYSEVSRIDSNYSVRHADSNNTAFHNGEPNHVTINNVQASSIISHSSPCHVSLKGSKSDPNGTVLNDYEDQDVEFKGLDKSDMLYKTLSSFELDKQPANTEGVQTARGYHKVHQLDPNDEESSSEEQSDESSDENDTEGDDDDDEYDYDGDDYDDDDVNEDGSSEADCGSVYSNDIGSELGWTDDGEEEQTSDDVTYSSGSDTDSQTDKPDENKCLL